MRLNLALLLTAPSLIAFAAQDIRRSRSAHHQHARNVAQKRCEEHDSKYKLVEQYKGRDFIDKFDYFEWEDPTHGSVNYLRREDAIAKNLTYIDNNGLFVLAVDGYTPLQVGEYRNSARIVSQKAYNGGLFIADIYKMPHGCSVWPAYWMVGPDWPAGGEIDILEGVHEQTTNQYTLHTTEGCNLDTTNPEGSAFTGRVINAKCGSSPGDNTGCAVVSEDQRTYGKGFNMIDGGVIAHLWTGDQITFWQFARGEIPQDIIDGNPNPDAWGTPAAHFPGTSCNISQFFRDNRIVINTTLCGDFAGSTFNDKGCAGTCAAAVADPNNFHNAQWKFASISVYEAAN